jgi:hypothetical protein
MNYLDLYMTHLRRKQQNATTPVSKDYQLPGLIGLAAVSPTEARKCKEEYNNALRRLKELAQTGGPLLDMQIDDLIGHMMHLLKQIGAYTDDEVKRGFQLE